MNHHGTLKLVGKSTASFIYANGFLLLTVVAVQAIGWLLVSNTALTNQLSTGERATATLREQKRHAYMAFALYALLAVTALWFPITTAAIVGLTDLASDWY